MQCFFPNHWWWLCDAKFPDIETRIWGVGFSGKAGFAVALVLCVIAFPAVIVWLSSKMNGRMK